MTRVEKKMAKPTADDRVWSCWLLLLLRQRNALSDPPSRLFANPPCFLRPRSAPISRQRSVSKQTCLLLSVEAGRGEKSGPGGFVYRGGRGNGGRAPFRDRRNWILRRRRAKRRKEKATAISKWWRADGRTPVHRILPPLSLVWGRPLCLFLASSSFLVPTNISLGPFRRGCSRGRSQASYTGFAPVKDFLQRRFAPQNMTNLAQCFPLQT